MMSISLKQWLSAPITLGDQPDSHREVFLLFKGNVLHCSWLCPADFLNDGLRRLLRDNCLTRTGLTSEIITRFDVDPGSVYIAGMSAGGAMAVIMGHTYPELYSAIGVHSGLPYQSAHDVISAFAAMSGKSKSAKSALKSRVIVFHGEADTTVHPSNALAIVASGNQAKELTATVHLIDGRKYKRTRVEDHSKLPLSELWLIEEAGHTWSGGSAAGSYTDIKGPDASKEMIRFFLGDRKLADHEK